MFRKTSFSESPYSLSTSSCNDHCKESKHDDLDTGTKSIQNVRVDSITQSQSGASKKNYAHMSQSGLAKKIYSFKISDNGNHQKSAGHTEATGDNWFSRLPPELTGHIGRLLSPLDCIIMESLTGKWFIDKKMHTVALNSREYYEGKGFTEEAFDKLSPEWKKLPEIQKLEKAKNHDCFPYCFHDVISKSMGKYKLTTKEIKQPFSPDEILLSNEDVPPRENFLQKKRNQAFNYEPFRDWFSRQAGSIVEAHMLGHNENNFVAVTNEGEISIVGKDIRNTDSQIPAIVKKKDYKSLEMSVDP